MMLNQEPTMMSYTEFRQLATDVTTEIADHDWSRILIIIMLFFSAMLAPIPVVRGVLFLFACLDISRHVSIPESRSITESRCDGIQTDYS